MRDQVRGIAGLLGSNTLNQADGVIGHSGTAVPGDLEMALAHASSSSDLDDSGGHASELRLPFGFEIGEKFWVDDANR